VRIVALTIRTDDEFDRALDALAKGEGTSQQEVIRRAVLDRYERLAHAHEARISADRMPGR
jgi:predicted transcriptional regulator